MTVHVEVVDHTGSAGPVGPVVELIEAVLQAERMVGALTVALVDEEAITELNDRYRGIPEPTDVLAFRYTGGEKDWVEQPVPGHEAETVAPRPAEAADLGEVVLCPVVVKRYAQEEGSDPGTQLAWTLLHGVLHLLGYDHEEDEGQMRQREQELLARLGRQVAALSIHPAP